MKLFSDEIEGWKKFKLTRNEKLAILFFKINVDSMDIDIVKLSEFFCKKKKRIYVKAIKTELERAHDLLREKKKASSKFVVRKETTGGTMVKVNSVEDLLKRLKAFFNEGDRMIQVKNKFEETQEKQGSLGMSYVECR